MRSACRLLLIGLAPLLFVAIILARQLGAREAREKVASALGLDRSLVHIKSISGGTSNAVVEVTFDGTFHLVRDKSGDWVVSEVRLGDRHWESIELIQTAVRKEKILRTVAELKALAAALEAFRREHGFYVTADTSSALVDNLAPRYINSVIRFDAWSHEFQYKGTPTSYRLYSLGPDGKPDTGDEIVIEDGRLVNEPESLVVEEKPVGIR
jgi:hypothetical protein